MKDFKAGVCNTLIATCVAEEGIDVGEVDLIVCFDVNNTNTTRYIQRIGRTGRKRQGKVIMLVTRGREETTLNRVMATKDGTNQKISKSSEITKALYRDSPRMVPPEFRPQCIETFIKIDVEQTITTEPSTSDVQRSSSRVQTTAVAVPSTSKAQKPKTKSNKRAQPPRGAKQPDIRRALAKRVELDDEILRDFDVPDLNTSTMSHGIYDETMSEKFCPADTSIQRSAGELSTTEKFMKICERYREIKICSNIERKSLDAAAVINNTKLAKSLKLLWLRNNLELVREHYNRRQTSRLYSSIAKIIGGDRGVQRMLSAPTEQWSDIKPMRQISIFKMLNFVNRELPKANLLENDSEHSQAAALALESQQSFGFVESKYASQFESQVPIATPAPSHSEAISSSTPKRVNKIAANNVQPPNDSPIQKTMTLERTCLTNKKVIPDTVPYYLRYLGLSSIDDLFPDSDSDDDANPQSNALITEKTDANSNEIPANEMDESDLFADDSSIFSKTLNTSAVPFHTVATTTTPTANRVNRLNIGSISDLFPDDDSDDDSNAIAKEETILKTDSDDTEEYDFEEIISVIKVAEAAETAVNRFVDTDQKENRNENQAQAVVQQKSDDLFATYNETIGTNANRNNANETHASKFSVPTTPKVTDQKKHSGMSLNSSSPHSPSVRLNYAIIQDKSPSVLNRSSVSHSTSGTSSKSLLGKFNATVQSSDAQSDANHSLRFDSPSTSNQPKKLNFSRLKVNAAASVDNMSDEIAPSQFLTCKEATTTGQNAVTVVNLHTDQMSINISTESETPDEDEIFATCKMVDAQSIFFSSISR